MDLIRVQTWSTQLNKINYFKCDTQSIHLTFPLTLSSVSGLLLSQVRVCDRHTALVIQDSTTTSLTPQKTLVLTDQLSVLADTPASSMLSGVMWAGDLISYINHTEHTDPSHRDFDRCVVVSACSVSGNYRKWFKINEATQKVQNRTFLDWCFSKNRPVCGGQDSSDQPASQVWKACSLSFRILCVKPSRSLH